MRYSTTLNFQLYNNNQAEVHRNNFGQLTGSIYGPDCYHWVADSQAGASAVS